MFGIPDNVEQKIIDSFDEYAEEVSKAGKLPETMKVSRFVRDTIYPHIKNSSVDERLLAMTKAEWVLHQKMEYKHHIDPVNKICDSMRGKERFEALGKQYLSLRQSRLSRAGLSLENHISFELDLFNLSYSVRKFCGEGHGRPDLLFPGIKEYKDENFPADQLIMVEVKRTTKERWREILKTAPRAEKRFMMLVEEGVSKALLEELSGHGFGIVIPTPLQTHYPTVKRLKVYSFQQFLDVAEAYQQVEEQEAM